MTHDEDSLVDEVLLFLKDENQETVSVGEAHLDPDAGEVFVCLNLTTLRPRELVSLAEQAMVAASRLTAPKGV